MPKHEVDITQTEEKISGPGLWSKSNVSFSFGDTRTRIKVSR